MNERAASLEDRRAADGTIALHAAPLAVYALAFMVVPISALRLAFAEPSFSAALGGAWSGLSAFSRLLGMPDAIRAMLGTVWIGALRAVTLFICSFAVALPVARLGNRLVRRGVKLMLIAPALLSWVSIATGLRSVFSVDGPMVARLAAFGLEADFFGDPRFFTIPFMSGILSKDLGFFTLLFVDAIESIDRGLIDAARCDGASEPKIVRTIIAPLVMDRAALVAVLLALSFAGSTFEPLMTLANPALRSDWDTLGTYAYRVGVAGGDMSIAMAVMVLDGLLGLAVALPVLALLGSSAARSSRNLLDGSRHPIGGRNAVVPFGLVLAGIVTLLPVAALVAGSGGFDAAIFRDHRFARAALASLMQGIGGALTGVLLAYSFAALFSGRSVTGTSFAAFVAASLAGFFSGGFVGSYVAARLIGIVDTSFALFLPWAFNPALAWFAFLEFRSLRAGIGDALEVDGVGAFRLPIELAKAAGPAFATIAAISFVASWNNWFAGVLLTHRESLTPLPALVRSLGLSDTSALSLGQARVAPGLADRSALALASSILPAGLLALAGIITRRKS